MGEVQQTMRAVRFHGQRDIRLENVPVPPKCQKDQVKVKPAFVGICGTDLHEYLGGPSLCPSATPHPITQEKVPITFGHEFSGTIEEIGEGVTGIAVGDHVSVRPIIYDGTCGACLEGHINCCWQFGFIGLSGWGGGLSEHVICPAASIFKLPESVPLDLGALVEPLAVGWHAVKLSGIKAGETALVLGGGPIGLCVVQALLARDVATVIVSEVAAKRKQFSSDFGAHHVIDPSKEDVVKRCRELATSDGVHYVFDAAGVQAAVNTAVLALRVRGTMVNIAIWEREMTLRPNDWIFKERKWLTTATYQGGDFEEVIDAIATGKMKPRNMITLKIAMDEVEEKGFKSLISNKDDHVKILIEVS